MRPLCAVVAGFSKSGDKRLKTENHYNTRIMICTRAIVCFSIPLFAVVASKQTLIGG